MWNKPTEKQLEKLPAFYSSENTPIEEKIIYMHFFIGGCDWYACEYSPEEQCFFGFAILNNDLQNAEWGYFSLQELCEVRVSFVEIDREVNWKPIQAKNIEKIAQAQGWLVKA